MSIVLLHLHVWGATCYSLNLHSHLFTRKKEITELYLTRWKGWIKEIREESFMPCQWWGSPQIILAVNIFVWKHTHCSCVLSGLNVLNAMNTVHSTSGHNRRLKQDSYSLICRLEKADYVTVINTDAIYQNRHVFRLPHATVSPES